MDDTATHNDSLDSVDAHMFLSYNAQQSWCNGKENACSITGSRTYNMN